MILIILIALVIIGAIVVFIWALAGLHWQLPDEDRDYLDPLPRILRAIWPLIRFVSNYFGSRMPTPLLEQLHQSIARSGANYVVELDPGEPVNRHRPSVDVLFHSAAALAGGNAVGVILTGMGKDGAQGLLAMRRAGAVTYAQDEASCVVFGMPREALHIGAAAEAVALAEMSRRILDSCGAFGHRV